jgi:hypothetical protein
MTNGATTSSPFLGKNEREIVKENEEKKTLTNLVEIGNHQGCW